jgi:hypothetical protein
MWMQFLLSRTHAKNFGLNYRRVLAGKLSEPLSQGRRVSFHPVTLRKARSSSESFEKRLQGCRVKANLLSLFPNNNGRIVLRPSEHVHTKVI